MTGLGLGVLLALAGCATQVPSVNEPIATGRDAGKRVRLGWVSWLDDQTLFACNRRVDDSGQSVGVMGPCARFDAEGRHGVMSWGNTELPDRTRSDASPGPRCKIELEDAQLLPTPKPARVFVTVGGERKLLDEWKPDKAMSGDAFAIEPSFSPDGKTVAYVHVAIGLGEGERIVEIPDARLAPAPECK